MKKNVPQVLSTALRPFGKRNAELSCATLHGTEAASCSLRNNTRRHGCHALVAILMNCITLSWNAKTVRSPLQIALFSASVKCSYSSSYLPEQWSQIHVVPIATAPSRTARLHTAPGFSYRRRYYTQHNESLQNWKRKNKTLISDQINLSVFFRPSRSSTSYHRLVSSFLSVPYFRTSSHFFLASSVS